MHDYKKQKLWNIQPAVGWGSVPWLELIWLYSINVLKLVNVFSTPILD